MQNFLKRLRKIDIRGIVLAIIVGLSYYFVYTDVYNNVDIVPATEQDYLALEQIARCIESNPNVPVNMNEVNSEAGSGFEATFENSECLVTVSYASDMSIVSLHRTDKALPLILAAISSIISGIVVAAIVFIVTFGFLFFIPSRLESFFSKMRKKAKKDTVHTENNG